MRLPQKSAAITCLSLCLAWPPLSYSFDYTYGVTNNAAGAGLNWSMTPQYLGADAIGGMDIHGIIYQYKAVKEKEDDFTVTVQNEKEGGGYVFQDTEDWSQKYGITIRKSFALPYTPLATFKEDGGSIATTGTGTVENAQVVYLYRFDRCFIPTDSDCPNYVPPLPPKPPEIKLYDALEDEFVAEATKETDQDLIESEEQNQEDKKEEEEKESLQMALMINENALTLANEINQSSLIDSMNSATNLSAYYLAQIPSKVYRETVVLKGGQIKDNKRVFRSLGQDRLHNKMVEAQYQ